MVFLHKPLARTSLIIKIGREGTGLFKDLPQKAFEVALISFSRVLVQSLLIILGVTTTNLVGRRLAFFDVAPVNQN